MNKKKWSLEEQALFLERVGELLGNGYTLKEAIEFLQLQLKAIRKNSLTHALDQLQKGDYFYQILKSMQFHPAAVSFTFYGEVNGQFSNLLYTAGVILNKSVAVKQKINKLLSYPLFLMIFTVLILILFQKMLLGHFLDLYQSFNAEPTGFFKTMIWINEHPIYLTTICFMVLISSLGVYFHFWMKRSPYEKECLLVRLPVIGKLNRLWNTYYIAYHLSQLLKNGISLADSLDLISQDPYKKDLKRAVEKLKLSLLDGKKFHDAVSEIPYWQKEFSSVIDHGEKTGKLDLELETYSHYCFNKFVDRIEKITKIIQPLIFSLIGLLILVMYFSIMMPAFQLLNTF